ncbi:NAD(P)/FAD-dependent oxidoreductase [Kibdelosporangium phytohabitans]|uniref:Oxidoreductase n=1 Tax=Kibdelosporangium phytohabitans TaxID=860235 RepID=A0A0N7F4P8_9PSEU|nr:NAD(P)/FAD-dependent oxidoreductase [Kibdelosporangium phytohabitans]ALG12031.1 oxidoreductase [Kibdelosporangium phytohabitans]MBE1463509.1 phytoene dehydrogenase-like protein [Kibdelosporangium phytohabitans]
MVERTDVVVVGAGLAGLSAAWRLRQAGLDVVVCESADEVGGRVRTDVVDGFRLDRGFQVLLPSYPAVKALPGLASLRLQPFARGVVAAGADGRTELVPRRSALGDVARFAVQHTRDVLSLAAFSARDIAAPAKAIRSKPRRTTAAELSEVGLSPGLVDSVFRPFLAGVFLDRDLGTSSRVFHLIWRSFLRGGGALPASGMGALPHLLASFLRPGTVRCNTHVSAVTEHGVRLRTRHAIHARAVVVATDGTAAAQLLPGVTAPEWHSVVTYYYRLPAPPPDTGSTLLVDGELLLNTAVISNVAPGHAPPGRALVAASIPEPSDDPDLEGVVRERLSTLYGTDTSGWDLLRTYEIPQALPVMGPQHPLRQPVRIADGRYVCGDHRDTSSIQGALVSGRRAAAAVIQDLAARGQAARG